MILSKICPICGGHTIIKEVTEVIRGSKHTATLKVQAEVCMRCDKRLYTPETVRYFEDIKAKLEREETREFQPVGKSFEVV